MAQPYRLDGIGIQIAIVFIIRVWEAGFAMKLLLMIMAVVETLAGAAFLLIPSTAFSTLLNVPLDTPAGLAAGRLAGAAILGLAIACWNARDSERNGAALAVVRAMAFFNVLAAAIIIWAGLRLGIQSLFLWPLMVTHAALGAWCIVLLWRAMRKS